ERFQHQQAGGQVKGAGQVGERVGEEGRADGGAARRDVDGVVGRVVEPFQPRDVGGEVEAPLGGEHVPEVAQLHAGEGVGQGLVEGDALAVHVQRDVVPVLGGPGFAVEDDPPAGVAGAHV